jgi:hypothetical protein
VPSFIARQVVLTAFAGHLCSSSIAGHDTKGFAPLHPHGALPLNYGHGGGETLHFVANEMRDMDVGFAKVFFADTQFDMAIIAQRALETVGLDEGPQSLPQDRTNAGRIDARVLWSEITLPILQMKSP